MSLPVFLVETLPAPGIFVLEGAEGRHAAAVRRMRPGEQLLLSDGAGHRALATVSAVAKQQLELQVAVAEFHPAPDLRFTLVQGLPKGERSELAVEMATEAGIDRIVPWQAQRCIARWDGSHEKRIKAVERWRMTVRQAAKQARRSWVPEVADLVKLPQLIQMIAATDVALILHEQATTPLEDIEFPDTGEILIIVGPEGGIAPEEIAELIPAGAQPITLGPHVLRTSTAAAVALGGLHVLTRRW